MSSYSCTTCKTSKLASKHTKPRCSICGCLMTKEINLEPIYQHVMEALEDAEMVDSSKGYVELVDALISELDTRKDFCITMHAEVFEDMVKDKIEHGDAPTPLYTYKEVTPFFANMGNEQGKQYRIEKRNECIAICLDENEAKEVTAKLNKSNPTYDHLQVVSQYCANTGGNCMVDLVQLSNGRVFAVNDECLILYRSMDHFWDSETQDECLLAVHFKLGQDIESIPQGSKMMYVKEVKVHPGEHVEVQTTHGVTVSYKF